MNENVIALYDSVIPVSTQQINIGTALVWREATLFVRGLLVMKSLVLPYLDKIDCCINFLVYH